MPCVLFAADETLQLPLFRVEGTPWRYARHEGMEVLTRASLPRSRTMVAALFRGQRLLPNIYTEDAKLPLKLILVEEREHVISGLEKLNQTTADERRWRKGYWSVTGAFHEAADADEQVFALNLADIYPLWGILMLRARGLIAAQSPAFPDWVIQGLFGSCGVIEHAVGVPHTSTVQLPKLSWPDAAMPRESFPPEAGEFPHFSAMFDPKKAITTLRPAERLQFEFQTGLFARWSLFGPANQDRNRYGYWALAEMARRGRLTEKIFQECIGVDYPTACAEMRRYLKSRRLDMIELRMPQVMAEVPEAENLEFRTATPAEVTRILSEYQRLFSPSSPQLQ